MLQIKSCLFIVSHFLRYIDGSQKPKYANTVLITKYISACFSGFMLNCMYSNSSIFLKTNLVFPRWNALPCISEQNPGVLPMMDYSEGGGAFSG